MTHSLHWSAAQDTARMISSKWAASEPGGVILAFDRNGVRFSESGGLADLQQQTPFTDKSVGRFASITKHIFCALVLMHSDKIGLDDPLGRHLPELKPPLANVTVGQALDMTGGLSDMRECLTLLGLSVHSETDKNQNLDFMARQCRLNFDAGTEISYSNTGYRLVEIALERKGITLRDFLTNQINKPLGLGLGAPELWSEPVQALIPGYWHNGTEWLSTHAGLQISASGSLTASAIDLAGWLVALLKGEGQWEGILEQLAAPRTLKDGRTTGYGLGLRHVALGDFDLVGHGGSHPGYMSHFLLDRQEGCGTVILSNRDDMDCYGAALQTMASLLSVPLPALATNALTDGLYVTETGPYWLCINGAEVSWLDDCVALYDDGEGWASSRSATTPIRLRQDGENIIGDVGHKQRMFRPAEAATVPNGLAGLWQSDEGAFLEIDGSQIMMGTGPLRQTMPLTALGNGRYLFTLQDSLWTRRICLHQLSEDHIELVLSRARMIEYRRR